MNADARAYSSLVVANLKTYVRNPIATFSLCAVLIVILLAFKFVFDGPGPHAKVVVVNSSSSPEAAALVAQLRAVPTFDVTEAAPATARSLLEQGKADLEVTIPPTFITRDAAGNPAPVQLQVTYGSGAAVQSSLPVLRGVVETFNESVLKAVPPVTIEASGLGTRTSAAIDFVLPGIVAFNIIGSALMMAAGVFSNYKSTGVMRRVKATGISPSSFVLAHATSAFAIGITQTAAILVAASLLFTIHLDLVALFLLLVLGYLVFLGVGLTVSGWISDAQRATAVAQGVAFPMIFVGLLAAALPAGISDVVKYLPVSYLTDGLHELADGGTLASVQWDLLWLAGWAVAVLLGAGRVFRWD